MIFAGIDVGSLCTKTVLIDGDGKIITYNIIRSGAFYSDAAQDSFKKALDEKGLDPEDITYTVATGYGRARVEFANEEITEITCHAKGASFIFPDVRTLIDIGGQDSKVLSIEGGRVMNFVMNDKCAAGTGRFLEVMAQTLGIDLERLGELWFESKKKIEVSSMCVVFAETEVISLFSKGHDIADIAAAVERAIARRITGMVAQVGVRERVVMSGGVAKNKGVIKALEESLGKEISIPPEPQIIGALGASLLARERYYDIMGKENG